MCRRTRGRDGHGDGASRRTRELADAKEPHHKDRKRTHDRDALAPPTTTAAAVELGKQPFGTSRTRGTIRREIVWGDASQQPGQHGEAGKLVATRRTPLNVRRDSHPLPGIERPE
jgi:hypothetical protein